MPYEVPYIDLPTQHRNLEPEVLSSVKEILSSGSFILRDEVRQLEENLASYLGVRHVIGVNSGTDALYLSLHAAGLKPGDEVITVSHTFVATISVVKHCGATPILIDIRDDYNMDVEKLGAAINSKTRAIIPVHMNGRMCDMEKIVPLAQKHGLVSIEDAAQSLGASFGRKMAGTWGWAGCFSMHPMKNLGGAGDGGFVATDDAGLAEKLRLLRNHGQATKEDIRCFGFNSRLDNLQAAILKVKLNHFSNWIERRREVAKLYHEGLKDLEWLELPPPPVKSDHYDVYSSYVIRSAGRDRLMEHLRNESIEIFAHWGTPNHLQKDLKLDHFKLPVTERMSREVLSLPVYAEISEDQVRKVIRSVRNFRS